MPDDLTDIAAYYDADPEPEEKRLSEHQLEWALTWRVLERHLPRTGRVLDVGAATGRYSIELARRGYQVLALDLSAGLVERARTNVGAAGLSDRIRLAVADARDLDGAGVDDTSVDAVLMLGPLYHLIDESDRLSALREAHRVLKPRGVLFAAFLSRLGVLADLMRRAPAWIEDTAHVRSYLDRGRRPDNAAPGGFRAYFSLVAEIAPLLDRSGFETLELAGIEPELLRMTRASTTSPNLYVRAGWTSSKK